MGNKERYVVYIDGMPDRYVWAVSEREAQEYARSVGGEAYLSPE